MTELFNKAMRRRTVLGGAAAMAGTLAMPSILRAQDRSLKVGVYGGYFKDSFDANIFPVFTEETGIAVESIAEPTGEAWLVQLEQAARAGQAPADVSMMAQTPTRRGMTTDLWAPLDPSRISNFDDLLPTFVAEYPDGRLAGVGAVAWYITLVTNTDTYPEAPESWMALWDEANADKLGLLALVSNSFLLEVTAKTHMGGTDALDTEEGQLAAFEKLAEVKPNVRLWYRDEAQFEQALKSGEIPMGQYYHDVTGLAAADGHPCGGDIGIGRHPVIGQAIPAGKANDRHVGGKELQRGGHRRHALVVARNVDDRPAARLGLFQHQTCVKAFGRAAHLDVIAHCLTRSVAPCRSAQHVRVHVLIHAPHRGDKDRRHAYQLDVQPVALDAFDQRLTRQRLILDDMRRAHRQHRNQQQRKAQQENRLRELAVIDKPHKRHAGHGEGHQPGQQQPALARDK